ncbi:RNA12 protein-domain-containing protein [Tricharina praecox]|uniref:RNA12 protein-domain-containing protein n=1 Tax=Tricharina praecox TaxID=43433 RepID=UPI00222086ED|nr:RNA12 protein-domain-containing protein [Tricharina praecox]KAI5843705.1 RNA12 protein-domain-containing protein [Tricharina praecox]
MAMRRDVGSCLFRRFHVESIQRRRIPAITNGLRPAFGWRMTSSIGHNKDGFVQLGPDEQLLFFNNLLPRPLWVSTLMRVPVERKLQPFLQKYWSWRAPTLEQFLTEDCIPPSLRNGIFSTKEVIPRDRDGGTFVRYSSTDVAGAQREIDAHLKRHPVKVGYLFKQVKAFPVLGKPWLEDMMDHFPSKKLRVQFLGGDGGFLNEHVIFSLFRQYGKIKDIAPPSADPKFFWLPKFITVRFRNIRGATAAKNCIDGHFVDCEHTGKQVQLRVSYGPKMRIRSIEAQWAIDWALKNQRLALLVVALTCLLVVAITDMVIDVIAEDKIDLYETTSSDEPVKIATPAIEREIEELKSALKTSAVGVLGSPHGRLKLIKDHVLRDRVILIVDCKPIFDSSSERAFVDAFSQQVGYRQLFATFNRGFQFVLRQFSIYTEEAIQTPENEFDVVLEDLRERLKAKALKCKAPGQINEDYLVKNPDVRPLVVFDNFSHRREEYNIFHEKILKWTTDLVTDQYGGVILLSTDKSFSKPFQHEPFRLIQLSDDISFPGKTTYESSAPGILERYILPSRVNHSWTSPQAWHCIRGLSSENRLSYDRVLLHDLFRGNSGSEALLKLEEEGLITIIKDKSSGRPREIAPRTGVLLDAFGKLVQDVELAAQMEVRTHVASCEREVGNIVRWEEELQRLAGLKRQPEAREKYLLQKIEKAQKRVSEHDAKIEELTRRTLAADA